MIIMITFSILNGLKAPFHLQLYWITRDFLHDDWFTSSVVVDTGYWFLGQILEVGRFSAHQPAFSGLITASGWGLRSGAFLDTDPEFQCYDPWATLSLYFIFPCDVVKNTTVIRLDWTGQRSYFSKTNIFIAKSFVRISHHCCNRWQLWLSCVLWDVTYWRQVPG